MKHKARTKAMSWLLSLALALSLVPGMGLTAKAEPTPETYLDASGNSQTCTEYNEVNSTNGIKAGWNVVKSGTVSIGYQSISGDVNLILCDNTQLTVNGGALSALSIKNSGSLTIYAQSTGDSMGKLVASSNSQYALNAAKDITINGGKVSATTSGSNKQCIRADNGSVTINGGIVEANGTSNGIYADGGNVEINGGNVTAKASQWIAIYAYNGTVKNKIPGVGWANVDDSGDGTTIAVNETGYDMLNYKKVQFEAPAHTHSFTYTADGATITATCGADGCTLTDAKATLTIKPPANLVYDNKAKAATVEGTIPGVETPSIKYTGRDNTTYSESTTAPTETGDYTASVTLGEKTAGVDFTIKVASYTITIPAKLTVENAGWNATSGVTASGEIAEGTKLTVTATSANEWALRSGDNSVGYYLATAEGGAATTAWDFSVDELAKQGGTNKTLGAVVEEYINKPAGDYTDTVTFTASVEKAVITVTWNNNDITGSCNGTTFTKDGVTVTAAMLDFNDKNFLTNGTFTTTLGNFTKIEVTAAGGCSNMGSGWTVSNKKATWTGTASSTVSFGLGGSMDGILGMAGSVTMVFTIEPAN